MNYELKERITQIRNALTLIWNLHQSEFTFYEGIKIRYPEYTKGFYELSPLQREIEREELNKRRYLKM